MKNALLPLALICATPLAAQDEARNEFIRDNLLAVFYHELGHALIERLELPIYGQEEDAADVAAVMLTDRLYDNARAMEMTIAAAQGFNGEMILADGEPPAYWDSHGADEQRYFNTICIFYGGGPEEREEMITVMGLPEDRAETCEDEFNQADRSWGVVIDGLREDENEVSFSLDNRIEAAQLTQDVMATELAALNADLGLENVLPIVIDTCGEPNAFYDPVADNITMCSEFEDHLGEIYDALND